MLTIDLKQLNKNAGPALVFLRSRLNEPIKVKGSPGNPQTYKRQIGKTIGFASSCVNFDLKDTESSASIQD